MTSLNLTTNDFKHKLFLDIVVNYPKALKPTTAVNPAKNNFIDLINSIISKACPPVPLTKPKFTLKAIYLREGERLYVEPGSMLAFKNLEMKTKRINTGVVGFFTRYVFGGESIFVNKYIGKSGGGWLSLEEQYDGQIVEVVLNKQDPELKICHGAFIASSDNISLHAHYAGFKGWLKGKGFGTLNATLKDGTEGRVYICTNEGIVRAVHIEDGDPVIIDNNHILAYTSTLSVTIKKIGGIKSFIFGGEGLVNEFKGKGIVLLGSGAVTGQATLLTKLFNNIWQAFVEDAIPNGVVILYAVGGAALWDYLKTYFSGENR